VTKIYVNQEHSCKWSYGIASNARLLAASKLSLNV